MSVDVDARGWAVVGATTNCGFFDVEPGVLAALPLSAAIDDATTALENRAFQDDYFRQAGSAGVVVVFFDGFVSQDKSARLVYQAGTPFVRAVALVASSLLGRAIAAFSLGIRQAGPPVKMFATLDDALPWARSRLSSAGEETR